ncbi:MAG: sulfotransferase, partial [Alphaproteobacteria bacterium]
IFEVFRRGAAGAPGGSDPSEDWSRMGRAMMNEFSPRGLDRDDAIAAYERHNAAVRSDVPRSRLVEWQPGDGWEPLCRALGVPVPDEPFPHVNTSAEFRSRAGWD